MFRNHALQRAAVLVGDLQLDDRERMADALPEAAAIVASSLEELRVAEEELRIQNEALIRVRDQYEQRAAGQRRLFDLAPVALLVTDLYGSIYQANQAALGLFRRSFDRLERSSIVRFVPPAARRVFRQELARLSMVEATSDWLFSIAPDRETPIAISAAVRVIDAQSPGEAGGLYWCLRAANGARK